MSEYFTSFISTNVNEKSISHPVAVFMALLEFTKQSTAQTFSEYNSLLKSETVLLEKMGSSPISMIAGCDLFNRLLKRIPSKDSFEAWKDQILTDGFLLLQDFAEYRNKAADLGVKFIKDNQTILIHSYSRVVMLLLKKAKLACKRFNVIVTESVAPYDGYQIVKCLREQGISSVLIPDTAVAHVMESVDIVFVGAEAIAQNGGLINQVGTYQIAIVAQYASKPVYAVVESYKFLERFPLSQTDLPNDFQLSFSCDVNLTDPISLCKPVIDYTPPELVSLLFTDFGVLTPRDVAENVLFLIENT